MREHKTKVVLISGVGLVLIGLLVYLLYPRHKSERYLNAFAKNRFTLEGELAFLGTEEKWYNHVVESHLGADYSIEYPKETYFFLDGNYYVEDESNGRVLISNTGERYQIEEMFDRASVLSNYDFSDAKFSTSSSAEILEYSTGETILCNYEEYKLENVGHAIRLYYLSDELYAIQAKEDSRHLFYVTNFSKQPLTIGDISDS